MNRKYRWSFLTHSVEQIGLKPTVNDLVSVTYRPTVNRVKLENVLQNELLLSTFI